LSAAGIPAGLDALYLLPSPPPNRICRGGPMCPPPRLLHRTFAWSTQSCVPHRQSCRWMASGSFPRHLSSRLSLWGSPPGLPHRRFAWSTHSCAPHRMFAWSTQSCVPHRQSCRWSASGSFPRHLSSRLSLWRRPPGLPHRRFAWSKPPGLPHRMFAWSTQSCVPHRQSCRWSASGLSPPLSWRRHSHMVQSAVVVHPNLVRQAADVGQTFLSAAGIPAGLGALCPPPSLPPNRALPQWRRPPRLPHRMFAWSTHSCVPHRQSCRWMASGSFPRHLSSRLSLWGRPPGLPRRPWPPSPIALGTCIPPPSPESPRCFSIILLKSNLRQQTAFSMQ